MADWPPIQLSTDALNTTTPDFAHLMADLYIFIDQCTYTYGRLPPPIWNCHLQQIKYWLINVCSESPFKTVIFITALHCVKLYMLSFGIQLLEVKAFIYYLWKCSNVCKFQVFVVVVVLMISYCCCCVVYIITHGQQQEAEKQQHNENENKKIHVNWSFCSDADSY